MMGLTYMTVVMYSLNQDYDNAKISKRANGTYKIDLDSIKLIGGRESRWAVSGSPVE